MIDDFVGRPDKKSPAAETMNPKKEAEDFFPDLSGDTSKSAAPADPAFVPPQKSAEGNDEDVIDLSEEAKSVASTDQEPSSGEVRRWWHRPGDWFARLGKRQKTAAMIIGCAMIFGGGAGVYALVTGKDAPVPAVKPAPKAEAEPKPTTVASALSGLQVDPSLNERPVTAVMIENSMEARPQSGLLEAGVVFEAIAEGGITRFMALYQDTAPESIGPVRSARPYYIDWARGFDAAYAHAGGSPEALQLIRSLGAKDLDHHASYYQRVSNKYAPHNLYTSMSKLHQYEAAKGYVKSNFTGFARKNEAAAELPTAKTVTINTSSARYNSQYTYDAASNSYLRNQAGAPHADEKTSKQLAPKVVVAMVVPYSTSGKYSVYGTIGTGQVFVFQDGQVTTGTWQKAAREQQISFTDSAGQPLKLNPGQTWISALSAANKVAYQP